MTPGNQDETLGFLAGHQLAYVCVDMPQGHRDSIPPVLAATSPDLAVVRMHGHSGTWDSTDIHERLGYRYTAAELPEWAPKVRALAQDTVGTHVLFNNCYRDYAQVNAQRLTSLTAPQSADDPAEPSDPEGTGRARPRRNGDCATEPPCTPRFSRAAE
jgi:uncharacterized protein YecE (DUF72 family)